MEIISEEILIDEPASAIGIRVRLMLDDGMVKLLDFIDDGNQIKTRHVLEDSTAKETYTMLEDILDYEDEEDLDELYEYTKIIQD